VVDRMRKEWSGKGSEKVEAVLVLNLHGDAGPRLVDPVLDARSCKWL